jgi:hypothetical protein
MKNSKKFLQENWFKIILLILEAIFVFAVAFYIYFQIKKHNYNVLSGALRLCSDHRVEKYWRDCMHRNLKIYIGPLPKLNYPY